MADYRNDDDPTLPGGLAGMNRTPETDPEHLIPDHTAAPAVPGLVAGGVSGDPDAVRDEIERTRQRMSSTIDQIEGALQRKKGEIQEKLDVVAPIRERPWVFAAGVFGTGLVLGLLTGGGDDDDRDHVKVPRALLAGMNLNEGGETGNGSTGGAGYAGGAGFSGRPGEWEDRSRELLQVVTRQEEEIRDLRAALYDEDYAPEGYADLGTGDALAGADALGDVDVDDEWDEDWNYDDGGDALDDFGAFGVEGESGGFLKKAVAAAVAAGLAGVLGAAGKKIVRSRGRGGELDVEVDLERSGGSARDVRVDEEYLAARREGYAGDQYGGELEVEVELDRSRPYTGRYSVPQPRADYGYEAEYGRELEVEVEMERPRQQYAAGWEAQRERGLPVSPLAGAVAAGAAALVGGLVARLVRNRSHEEELDVEVELEQRPAYRPSAATTTVPRGTTATGGELQVEVELEERGGQAGFTSSPQPISAEREYEVELERPGGPSASGTTDSQSTGNAQTDPPLM
jgi:hypothetical protein